MKRTRRERIAAWMHRARHAWRVGLPGEPLPKRLLVRTLYTFGALSSPSYVFEMSTREREAQAATLAALRERAAAVLAEMSPLDVGPLARSAREDRPREERRAPNDLETS